MSFKPSLACVASEGSRRRIPVQLVASIVLLLTVLFIPESLHGGMGVVGTCRLGLFIVLFYASLIVLNGVLTPLSLVFAAFVMFSFGVPLLIAVNPNYTDFYLAQIDKDTFVQYSYYTIVCISAFGAALCLFGAGQDFRSEKKRSPIKRAYIKVSSFFTENMEATEKSLVLICVLSGLVCYYYAFRFAIVSLDLGIDAARLIVENSAIINLCRGLFIPSSFFLLAFSSTDNRKRILIAAMLGYSALAIVSGDRTEGLTLFAAIFVYWYRVSGKFNRSAVKAVIAIACCISVIFLIPMIASFRVGEGVAIGGVWDAVERVLSELGFNFYTVCFQSRLGLPQYHGVTYLASLSTLIPNSLDFLDIKSAADAMYGEVIYNSAMAANYGWATFGLGYSMVAESYLNFGYAGFIAVFCIGSCVGKLCCREFDGPCGLYITYSCLWAFFTIGRRGLDFPINSLKYILIVVPLLLVVVVLVTKRFFSDRGDGKRP